MTNREKAAFRKRMEEQARRAQQADEAETDAIIEEILEEYGGLENFKAYANSGEDIDAAIVRGHAELDRSLDAVIHAAGAEAVGAPAPEPLLPELEHWLMLRKLAHDTCPDALQIADVVTLERWYAL